MFVIKKSKTNLFSKKLKVLDYLGEKKKTKNKIKAKNFFNTL